MTTASPWQVRPDYQQDSEAAANRQISLELYATYLVNPTCAFFSSGRSTLALGRHTSSGMIRSQETWQRKQSA
uniref:Uncharacterized protein n=1 Tax=Canis lupus familiaris TaxID=9615 RepID=A0A8I3S0Z9_CANLF